MNESTIVIIAEAVLSNIRVLEKLIDALPVEVKAAVHEKVANVAPVVAVAPAPAPVVQAAPAPAPVAVAPMPAPPVFTAPVVAPAPTPSPIATVTTTTIEKAPFADAKGLIDFVMSAYKALGPQKGSGIQGVLTQLGYSNINDVNPAHYDALFAGVKALA